MSNHERVCQLMRDGPAHTRVSGWVGSPSLWWAPPLPMVLPPDTPCPKGWWCERMGGPQGVSAQDKRARMYVCVRQLMIRVCVRVSVR